MSFQLRHTFSPPAALLGAMISTCGHCETLRVEEGGGVNFVRRGDVTEAEEETYDPNDDGRARLRRRMVAVNLEPPCVSPPAFYKAPW